MLLFFIFTCAASLGVSFFCSLTEAVLLSLNPLDLKLQEKKGVHHAARWLLLKNRIERPISAILAFNTLANTGLATLAGALFTWLFGADWLWLFSIVMSAAVLFGGEMMPKIIGVHQPARYAPRLIAPLSWMIFICHPLILLMEKFCEKIKRGATQGQGRSDQIMDIITLVQSARAEQLLHSHEEIIMIHAATLSARRIKTAMVPHAAVKIFDTRKSLIENVQTLGPKLHRSYPVSRTGDAGKITGYIRVRELFLQNLTEPGGDWTHLIRPVLHISSTASLTQLLTLFLEQHEIASLVDDASGQMTGWITMDDVMKVLMGARV